MVAAYAVWVMMTYLTNVWTLDLSHAAAIVNVFTGAATIMPIGMAFLVDAFMGDYWMLLLSSLAYSFVGFPKFPSLIYVFLLCNQYCNFYFGLSCFNLYLPLQTSYNIGATM